MQLADARDAPGQGGDQDWAAARRAGGFSGDRESESFICVLDSATPGSYEVRGSKQLVLHVSVCETRFNTSPAAWMRRTPGAWRAPRACFGAGRQHCLKGSNAMERGSSSA
jgi:hypothetical protein